MEHWTSVVVPGAVGGVGLRSRGRWWWAGSVQGEGLGFLREGFGYLKVPPLIQITTTSYAK